MRLNKQGNRKGKVESFEIDTKNRFLKRKVLRGALIDIDWQRS